MEVIPAIDLRGGRCVRLYQGDYQKETVFSDDPAGMARRWAAEGAQRLHVVDLDGAAAGSPVNSDAIAGIIGAVSIPVQVGGGIRDLASIERLLSLGAARVSLGTAAVREPALLREACRLYSGAIIASIDARDGMVAVQGWQENTHVRAVDLLRQMEDLGVERFVYTDIARDGTGSGPNLEALGRILAAATHPVIAAGGVHSVEHLVALSGLGVEAAIVGQALYDGAVDLRLALAATAS